uniref:Uncharacterized protein n=1 Tax=Mesocestoides corti TaxID=53468 RepID=A0A5K3FW42_MESCO
MKKTGTTDRALVTNYKLEPRIRHRPSDSTTPPIIYCSSFVSFSGWLPTFLACHWNSTRQRIGCGL